MSSCHYARVRVIVRVRMWTSVCVCACACACACAYALRECPCLRACVSEIVSAYLVSSLAVTHL